MIRASVDAQPCICLDTVIRGVVTGTVICKWSGYSQLASPTVLVSMVYSILCLCDKITLEWKVSN